MSGARLVRVTPRRPVILCPLEIERRSIGRLLRERAEIVRTGPGAGAVRRGVEEALRAGAPPLLVLFGLAGGLRSGLTAPRIGRVMDKDARSWDAPLVAPGSGPAACVIGVDEPVTDRDRKKRMAEAYGADLVDCESHAFAEACAAAGVRWAVVRGVSDGPEVTLPAHAQEWVDAEGRTRVGRVFLACLLSPGVLPAVVQLGLRSKPALREARARLLEVLNHAASTIEEEKIGGVRRAGAGGEGRAVSAAAERAAANVIEAQLGRRGSRDAAPPAPGAR
ncbi:MAG: hypothetical protein SFZ24_02890 [Planctomycetota bacterium]|nr:hypothetical protein [Planctomycetota bacterium]